MAKKCTCEEAPFLLQLSLADSPWMIVQPSKMCVLERVWYTHTHTHEWVPACGGIPFPSPHTNMIYVSPPWNAIRAQSIFPTFTTLLVCRPPSSCDNFPHQPEKSLLVYRWMGPQIARKHRWKTATVTASLLTFAFETPNGACSRSVVPEELGETSFTPTGKGEDT